jgi:hypothetical protein
VAYIDNLITRRDNVAARLAALTEGSVGDKANTNGGAGSAVDHVGYRQSLLQELRELNELIKEAAEAAQAVDVAQNGPWEIRS